MTRTPTGRIVRKKHRPPVRELGQNQAAGRECGARAGAILNSRPARATRVGRKKTRGGTDRPGANYERSPARATPGPSQPRGGTALQPGPARPPTNMSGAPASSASSKATRRRGKWGGSPHAGPGHELRAVARVPGRRHALAQGSSSRSGARKPDNVFIEVIVRSSKRAPGGCATFYELTDHGARSRPTCTTSCARRCRGTRWTGRSVEGRDRRASRGALSATMLRLPHRERAGHGHDAGLARPRGDERDQRVEALEGGVGEKARATRSWWSSPPRPRPSPVLSGVGVARRKPDGSRAASRGSRRTSRARRPRTSWCADHAVLRRPASVAARVSHGYIPRTSNFLDILFITPPGAHNSGDTAGGRGKAGAGGGDARDVVSPSLLKAGPRSSPLAVRLRRAAAAASFRRARGRACALGLRQAVVGGGGRGRRGGRRGRGLDERGRVRAALLVFLLLAALELQAAAAGRSCRRPSALVLTPLFVKGQAPEGNTKCGRTRPAKNAAAIGQKHSMPHSGPNTRAR